ncbi:MAG: DUF2490 domain-containing protein [Cyclobacteriaceae bacterium]
MRKRLLLGLVILIPFISKAQVDEDQLGAWYMYFYTAKFKNSQWGLQGDAQYRNWDVGGDLEQLLLRSGVTYTPRNANVLLTFGYANITTGAFGESTSTSVENRIYQEAMYPVQLGARIYLNHRFRFEQRFVKGQDFRTRYRYNLFMNVPLNSTEMTERTVYLALYNEIFLNGQKDIGGGNEVETFDRNRFYAALGYYLTPRLKTQLGVMRQTTSTIGKNQLQVSLHHSF